MQRLVNLVFLFGAMAEGVCAEVQPDFLLDNVNRNSSRPNARVSPRDYRLQISAYYFGAAG